MTQRSTLTTLFDDHPPLDYMSLQNTAAAAAATTYQTFTRQHFKQLDEHLAISQVDVQVLDAAVDTHQMRVDPLGECLLLHALSLIFTRTRHTLIRTPTVIHSFISGMHPYECIAPNVDINLNQSKSGLF